MKSCGRKWLWLAMIFGMPALQAAALPEMLLLQQTSTTQGSRPITVPQSEQPPSQSAPVVVPVAPGGGPARNVLQGLETIIGGANPAAQSSGAPTEEAEAPEAQPGAPQQQQQAAPGQAAPQQQLVQPAAPSQPTGPVITRLEASGPGLMLLFDNAPLNTVINLIMKELGYSYMVDPAVQGTVNIQTTQPIKREDLFAALELILRLNNAAIVQSGEIYLIVPISEGIRAPHQILLELEQRTEVVRPSGAAPAGPPEESRVIAVQGPPGAGDERGLVTAIIPLMFVPSSEMTTIIQPFMSGGAVVLSYDSKNILILTDFKTNIEKVKKLIDILDTKFFDINNTELVPVRYNRAPEVAADLAKVFGAGGESSSVGLIPIERLNSILVIAHSKQVLEEVHKWIEKLDSPSGGMNLQTFVYQVENSTAGNIADILSQLYSDGSGLPSQSTAEGQTPPAAGQPQTPQQQRQSIRPQESASPVRGLRPSLGPSLEGRPISERAAPGTGGLLGGNIKIIVNEFNNSLIIQATEADYKYIERAIKQLDVLPRQVLIEAKVYSVELRDELSFGIAAFLEQREQALATTASVTAPQGQTAGGALLAATRFIVGDSRQIEATLNALRSKTDVKVLEAPRLLAIDGQQATINIGAEVPVTTSSFGDPVVSGSPGAFLNQIQFRPTGTSLLINPRISASGMVTMDLAIEISSAVGTGLTPTINRNYVETSLIVKDGHTIAIGGIISDTNSLTRSRVPLLGDLPLLGALFGQTSRNARRSELVILITPHVVATVPQADTLGQDLRRAMRRAYDFIREKEETEKELVAERARKDAQEEQKRQEKEQKRQQSEP
ncbi:MAG: hypothetical protein HYX74_07600 [Acidobacteria bacterium]|nr:hypothetical protein [Acidobacteriota bacterium]